MGLDDAIQRLMGAIIVLAGFFAIFAYLVNAIQTARIDPLTGGIILLALFIVPIGAFIYIFREKTMS